MDLGLGQQVQRAKAEAWLEASHIDPEPCMAAIGREADGKISAWRTDDQAADDRVAQLTTTARRREVGRGEADEGKVAGEEERAKAMPAAGATSDSDERMAGDEPRVGLAKGDEQGDGSTSKVARDEAAMAGDSAASSDIESINDPDRALLHTNRLARGLGDSSRA